MKESQLKIINDLKEKIDAINQGETLELIREALSFYIDFQEGQPNQFKLPTLIHELREVERKIIELREAAKFQNRK